MKNGDPRYTNRRRRRGGGERKSTKKYLTMKRRLGEEYSPHERRIGANELIAAGVAPTHMDDPFLYKWINLDKRHGGKGRSRTRSSGKSRGVLLARLSDELLPHKGCYLDQPEPPAPTQLQLNAKIRDDVLLLENLQRTILQAEKQLEAHLLARKYTHPTSHV